MRAMVAALVVGMLALSGCSHTAATGAHAGGAVASNFRPAPEGSGEQAFWTPPARRSVTGYAFANPADDARLRELPNRTAQTP